MTIPDDGQVRMGWMHGPCRPISDEALAEQIDWLANGTDPIAIECRAILARHQEGLKSATGRWSGPPAIKVVKRRRPDPAKALGKRKAARR